MLYNTQGQRVNVPAKFNSKEQPHIFANLREVHEPQPTKGFGSMFSIEVRAKIKA